MLITQYNSIPRAIVNGYTSFTPIEFNPADIYQSSSAIMKAPDLLSERNLHFVQYIPNSGTVYPLTKSVTRGSQPNDFGEANSFKISYRFKIGSSAYLIFAFENASGGTSPSCYIYLTNNNTFTITDINNLLDMFSYTYSIALSDENPLGQYDLVSTTVNGSEYIGVMLQSMSQSGTLSGGNGILFSVSDLTNFYGSFDTKEYDTDYGDYSSSGGYSGGSFDDSSDTIGIPGMPKLSVSSMGFVNVYKPGPLSLQGMVDELFPQVDVPDIPAGNSLADVVNSINGLIDTVANGIIQFGNKNLLDYVLDAHIIPVSPPTSTASNIKVGYKTLSISAPKVSQDYVDFNCGTLNIKEYYTNYIDYMTTIKLYLPFVGFVPLQPEYVQNGKLNVTYRFNILDGSFCAWVLSTSSKSKLSNTVVGSFSGNCCVHIPISASNYSNVISGMVNGVSNTINAGAKGNIGGMVESSENLIQATKPDVSLSNGYNATSSYSGIRVPYLIIERPVASFSANYPKEKGLPLNVTKTLKNVKGFTIASDIILDKINASNIELEMIKNLFKGGVIL